MSEQSRNPDPLLEVIARLRKLERHVLWYDLWVTLVAIGVVVSWVVRAVR